MLVERARDFESRRALLDQKHGNALRGLAARIALRSDAIEIAIDAVGDEGLRAVEHEMIAVAPRGRADGFHVGARARLGHADRDDLFAGDDVRHVFVFLRLRSAIEDVDRRHVGMHQHGDRKAGKGGAAEFLRQNDGRERVHVRAAIFGRIADAEKAELAHPPQHFARHEALLLPGRSLRLYFRLDKAAHLVAQHLVFFAKISGTAGICFGGGARSGHERSRHDTRGGTLETAPPARQMQPAQRSQQVIRRRMADTLLQRWSASRTARLSIRTISGIRRPFWPKAQAAFCLPTVIGIACGIIGCALLGAGFRRCQARHHERHVAGGSGAAPFCLDRER